MTIIQMREESESGIRKWEEMWFKMTAENGWRGAAGFYLFSDPKALLSYPIEILYKRYDADYQIG